MNELREESEVTHGRRVRLIRAGLWSSSPSELALSRAVVLYSNVQLRICWTAVMLPVPAVNPT